MDVCVMDALTCLKTRRSIRAYEDRQVDEALLAQVLEAGMYAPTGMGRSVAQDGGRAGPGNP